MSNPHRNQRPDPGSNPVISIQPEQRLAEIAGLLRGLEKTVLPPLSEAQQELLDNQLIQVRLGIAGSLYMALRARHAATAAHAFRVAVQCSAWACVLGLSDAERDAIEVASLLHDVGKIGIPDEVLLKPSRLSPEEAAVMHRHWDAGLEILSTSCANLAVLDIVGRTRAWFDGTNPDCPAAGEQIPIGGRMLAIVDAFDAMTSNQLYRRAMSTERAFDELVRQAGTQFDPELVRSFVHQQNWDQRELRRRMYSRWLSSFDPDEAHKNWQFKLSAADAPAGGTSSGGIFEQKLLENMHDAVVFIDSSLQILYWNRGAERLTGHASETVLQRRWSPELLRLSNEEGRLLTEQQCPVAAAIKTNSQLLRRMTFYGRSGRALSIDAQIMPVNSPSGACLGACMLMHDVSPQISLEEKCQNLYELATKDPLTQVANRAEFDRVQSQFVDLHREQQHPCALIITDIDHFKSVNDNFGHQAGDEVLRSYAKALRSHARPGDLVARYGGEEFVMLCADCTNSAAAHRAEQIRRSLSQMSQPAINGKPVTASFGVTEIQPGDTPETMLRRADRALYQAKNAGRNTVVQLGSGSSDGDTDNNTTLRTSTDAEGVLVVQDLVSAGPLAMAVEKLRGFISDQHAEIVQSDDESIVLMVGRSGFFFRRNSDRGTCLLVRLDFEEQTIVLPARAQSSERNFIQTRIAVTIRPKRKRDRRRADAIERAGEVMASIRAYLMANESQSLTEDGEGLG